MLLVRMTRERERMRVMLRCRGSLSVVVERRQKVDRRKWVGTSVSAIDGEIFFTLAGLIAPKYMTDDRSMDS